MISLLAKLSLDTSQFAARLREAESSVKKAKQNTNVSATAANPLAAAVAGLAGVAAITAGIDSVIEQGSKVNDLADKFSLTTDTVQKLNFAALQTGTSVDTALMAIKKVAIASNDALSGNTDKADAFARLGVSAQDLATLSPEQIFFKIAEAMQNLPMTAQVFSDINDTLGKSGQELVPMFREGLAGLMSDAERLNTIMGPDTVAGIDRIGDALTTLKLTAQAWGAAILVPFWNVVTSIFGGLEMIGDFASTHLAHALSAPILLFKGEVKEALKELSKFLFFLDFFKDAEAGLQNAVELDRKDEESKDGTKRDERRKELMKGAGGLDADGNESGGAGGGAKGKAAAQAAKAEAEAERLRKLIEDRQDSRLPAAERLAKLEAKIAEAKKDAEDTNNDGSLENLRAQARVEEFSGKKEALNKHLDEKRNRELPENTRLKKIETDLKEAEKNPDARKGDGGVDNLRALARIEELKDDADGLRRLISDKKIDKLPEDKRLEKLKAELAKAKAAERAAPENTDAKFEAMGRVETLEAKIAAIETKKEKANAPERFEKDRVDSIQQIGGKIGESATISNGMKQLKTMEDVLKAVREGNINTEVLKPK